MVVNALFMQTKVKTASKTIKIG